MKICFATNNCHKLEEVAQMLPEFLTIQTLNEIGCLEELPETQPTIEGNALQKATFVANVYSLNCFADDTGLEVEILNGAPGVDTAHYAGKERDAKKNIAFLLENMKGEVNRRAAFKTVFALIWNQEIYTFEGRVEGCISVEPRGTGGFGYDPVFIPEGYDRTFAELGVETKNRLSHRALATKQLVEFLGKLR